VSSTERWITCREFIEFLMDYLESLLPEAQRREFDLHLAMCPACVAYLKTYQQTVAAGKAALAGPDERLPEEIPGELVKAILAARGKKQEP
jgi:anti-sigma factor RsiW